MPFWIFDRGRRLASTEFGVMASFVLVMYFALSGATADFWAPALAWRAGLLLIGEPPGSDEDRAGTPFAGREGALLDKMLASIGLDRAGLLLAPLIPWRPPGGRTPNPGELTVCLPFLQRVVALASPRRVLLLGGLAARTLLGPAAGRRRIYFGAARPLGR